ncbi:serine/threonine-protein kinase [Sorangium sp. So ce131]|uniref:serine/threonine-protein kinase n=1 Tax=Sorangium sp. So ce131 TaxID=3133282 RepID=UPI003F63AB9F
MSAEGAPAKPGDVIADRFVLEAKVASGGMGVVYRARDRRTGLPVALKLLDPQGDATGDRFQREAAVLADVIHPAIVRYVAHGVAEDGARYLAMEWLDGHDLQHELHERRRAGVEAATVAIEARGLIEARVLRRAGDARPPADRPGVLSVQECLELGRRVASALAEIHRRGMVHRDVKPSNLFLCGGAAGAVKLLDFGVARLTAASHDITTTGTLVGTPSYMAPEQARGQRRVEPPADVWALACVLYEALVGVPPFRGHDLPEILISILTDEPPPLGRLRRDVPPELEALVRAMLIKDPQARVQDGAAALAALEAIPDPGEAAPALSVRAPQALASRERRVSAFVLARAPEGDGGAVQQRALGEAARRAGGQIEARPDGALAVTLPRKGAPTDQAMRAARAALALRAALPEIRIAITTGSREGGAEAAPGGEVEERAAVELGRAAPGEIRLDHLTAALLDARFETSRGRLVGERPEEGARLLLGRPTPWVGRRREMGMLQAIFDECVEEPVARAVLVTAPAGMGKTRLRLEFARALRQAGRPFVELAGKGDSLSAGSPFVMIAPAVRRSAGILDGEPIERRRDKLRARLAAVMPGAPGAEIERVAVFLGEMIGVPFPSEGNEALSAARKDPMLLGDAMRAAFEDWLRAECEIGPVLLFLEDLHWGDLPSVRFIDAALRALRELPLCVVALARPEVHTVFPQLWAERAAQEIRLDALSRKASAELARDVLGEAAAPEEVDRIVERAAGNAFFLEELLRAAAEGGASAQPDTVLGMVQARLDGLGDEAKRILRAGAVFGEVFWLGGALDLLGPGARAADVQGWLAGLERAEVVVRAQSARIPGEVEYKFRHALVRDAAYAMLTEGDRALAHRLAGAWLEGARERDALVLAEHYARGGDRAAAARWFHRAAEQALEGSDLAAVIARAERAIEAGAEGEALGSLRRLQSTAAYWQSSYEAARRYGEQAAALLGRGGAGWFLAVGNALVSSARLGDYAGVDRWLDEALAAAPEPGAAAEQIICLCRGCFQLIFAGRSARADALLERVAALAGDPARLDPLTRAQVHHVRGVRAANAGDVSTFLTHLEAAIEAFEQAGDRRNASLEGPTLAFCYATLGDAARAEEMLPRAIAACERTGAQQAITYAKATLGYVLAERGKLGEARAALGEVIDACRAAGNGRLEGWARAHLAEVEHLAGDHEASEREGRAAAELLSASPGLLAWALAGHARALLALGRPEEALGRAREAMALLERLGGILHGEPLVWLVLAEALQANRDPDGARGVLHEARARLARRADGLARPGWRERFLAMRDPARTFALAAAWGAAPPP